MRWPSAPERLGATLISSASSAFYLCAYDGHRMGGAQASRPKPLDRPCGEMADAADLKSAALHRACGFKSHRGH